MHVLHFHFLTYTQFQALCTSELAVTSLYHNRVIYCLGFPILHQILSEVYLSFGSCTSTRAHETKLISSPYANVMRPFHLPFYHSADLPSFNSKSISNLTNLVQFSHLIIQKSSGKGCIWMSTHLQQDTSLGITFHCENQPFTPNPVSCLLTHWKSLENILMSFVSLEARDKRPLGNQNIQANASPMCTSPTKEE